MDPWSLGSSLASALQDIEKVVHSLWRTRMETEYHADVPTVPVCLGLRGFLDRELLMLKPGHS